MAKKKQFWRNEDGGMVEKFALMAGVVTLSSLAGAHGLKVLARDGGLPTILVIRGDNDLARTALNLPKSNGRPATATGASNIDYSSTASIRTQANQVLLDPCTGKPK